MTSPDTALDLDQFFAAIETSIASGFPGFVTVAAYPEDRVNLPTPACVIELVELEPAAEPGTGQLAAVAHVEASVIIGFREPGAKRRVAKMAAALAHHVQGERWGLPVEAATVTAIAPSDFAPELDQFEVWVVEWQQTVHIGRSIWGDDGAPPDQVLASWAPAIGPANEEEYQDIGGAVA